MRENGSVQIGKKFVAVQRIISIRRQKFFGLRREQEHSARHNAAIIKIAVRNNAAAVQVAVIVLFGSKAAGVGDISLRTVFQLAFQNGKVVAEQNLAALQNTKRRMRNLLLNPAQHLPAGQHFGVLFIKQSERHCFYIAAACRYQRLYLVLLRGVAGNG